jgi:hypothetical protein
MMVLAMMVVVSFRPLPTVIAVITGAIIMATPLS